MTRTQGYVPDVIPMEPPRFWTKPSESLKAIGRLTKLLLWPYGLFYIGLSVVVWNYFTPSPVCRASRSAGLPRSTCAIW